MDNKNIVILYLPFLILSLPFLILVLAYAFGFKVPLQSDPTYMNGILTGSSILFGFWATILGNPPQVEVDESIVDKRQVEKFLAKTDIKAVFYNLAFFFLAIFSMFFSSIGVLPSTFALCFVVDSFNINLYTLIIKLISSY